MDVIRGIALLGVLLVNLLTLFRVSLFLYLEVFHTEAGTLNHLVDWVVAIVIESKAFALFSLLFGVGLSIFRERAARRLAHPTRLLARRLVVLLGVGLAHLLLVWNGDILTEYAVAGLVVLPLLARRPGVALTISVAIGALYCLPLPVPEVLPHGTAALLHGAEAARVYGGGSWSAIFAFRWAETCRYIGPLLGLTLPRVIALLLLGDWAWRRGLVSKPHEHRGLLRATLVLGLLVGGAATATTALAATNGYRLGRLAPLVSSMSNVPLALGYAAGLLVLLERPWWRARLVPTLAPLGRMALTNYLMQSVIGSLLFYGFGAGLFARLDATTGALLALTIYVAQAVLSAAWLRWFRFGPFEWLWRSMTYGHWPPIRREPTEVER